MLREALWILPMVFMTLLVEGQIDTIKTHRITKTNENYKSFELINNKLFAISDSGKIVIWDLNSYDTIPFLHNDTTFRYTAICKDKYNNLFLGTNKGNIYKLNPLDLSISLYLIGKYSIHSLFFNSLNKLFLIVPNAVYEPLTKKYWKNFVHQPGGVIVKITKTGKITNKYFEMPQITFLDNQDRIWMANSFGEFGGSLQLFDSKKRKILSSKFNNLDMGLFFPKSIFNDSSGNIYITSGLQHFDNSGKIFRIDHKGIVSIIFNSREIKDSALNSITDDQLFVGPGAFNEKDQSIYFATTNGFYKIKIPFNGHSYNPQYLFSPSLTWERESLAIGVSMTIKQVRFTQDGRLLFLTSSDGFGIYDGIKLTPFK